MASEKIPLYLFQVLEEEYAALWENLEETSREVHLPDSGKPHHFKKVVFRFDWRFDASHIKDDKGLVDQLDLTPAIPILAAASQPQAVGDSNNNQAQTSIANLTVPQQSSLTSSGTIVSTNAQSPAPESKVRSQVGTGLDPDELARNELRQYLHGRLDPNKQGLAHILNSPKLVADALNQLLEVKLFAEERFTSKWLSMEARGLRDVHTSSELTGDDLAHFNRLLLDDSFPDFLESVHTIRLAAAHQRIHQAQPAALCLSGGGIRSATFALGLLQSLARHKLLDKFHYLSTVSGGGYIGSWLVAWIHRHRSGLKGMISELANLNPLTKVDPDPSPIRYLRRYSNFITPKVGLLSADSWTFAGIYLRNLFLNWIVFIPLLLSVLALPRVLVAVTLGQPARTEGLFSLNLIGSDFQVFERHFFLLGGFFLTIWSLAYIMFNRPTVREELRQCSPFWRSRATQRSFVRWCLLPLAGAAFCLTSYWAWSIQKSALHKQLVWFGLFGCVASIFGWVISSLVLRRRRRISSLKSKQIASIVGIELLALMLAGALGGLVLYLITPSIEPVEIAENWNPEIYVCLGVPTFMLVFLLCATLFIGLSSGSPRIDDEDREWWARLSAWVMIVILGWVVFTSLVIFGPPVLLSAPASLASFGGLSGILAAILGQSAKTPGSSKLAQQQGSGRSELLNSVMRRLLPLMAMVFIATLVVFLSLVTTVLFQQLALLANDKLPGSFTGYLTNTKEGFGSYLKFIYSNVSGQDLFQRAKVSHLYVLNLTSFLFVFLLGALLFVGGILLSVLMNLNIFSLHAGYRSRLIRAFLGASRPDHQRKADPFTGFDPADNVSMCELRAGLFDEDDFLSPVKLAEVLLNAKDAVVSNGNAKAVKVCQYLSRRGLIKTLASVPNPQDFSIRLVAALRKDLNGALQDPLLHKSLGNNAKSDLDSPNHWL